MAIFPGSAIPSAVSDDYEIDNSVRGDGTGYLERTPAVDSNRRTWTFSAWVKISGNDESMFGTPAGYPYMQWKFDAGSIEWMEYTGSYTFRLVTTQVFRDPSAWYHFVASVDTTQATASNRLKMYVNGEQITDFSTETYPAQNTELSWNKSGEAQRVLTGNTDPFEGYMAEVFSIDGTALTPSSFGELDSTTNQWIPLDSDDVKDAVTFGTNGFFQKYNSTELAASFEDSSNSSRYITGNRRSEITVSTDMSIYQGDNGDGSLNHQVDGSTANSNPRWYPNGETAAGKYLRYDFGSGNTVTITEAKWYQDTTATQGVWKWQGSDDASSWTDIGSSFTLGNGATGTSTPQVQTELNGNTTAYRYYQLLGISGSVVNAAYYLEIIFKQNLSHTITVNDDVINQRPQPHDVTANGDAHLIGPKVGTSAIHFGGSEDYLSAPAAASDFGSSNFTVEGWYNITAKDTGGTAFMAGGATGSNGWMVEWDDSGDMYFYWHNGSSEQNPSWSWSPAYNRWYYLAIARSGSSVDFWVDGVSQGSQSMSGTISAGDGWTLGVQPGSGNYSLKGYAGPQRLSDVARYTVGSDFTPPTDVWTNDSDTTLLIQNGTDGTDTFDDLSTPDHMISHSGDVRWFAPKVGAGAMAFDGSDEFEIANRTDLNPGSGNFTIEFWVKFADVSVNNQQLFFKRNSTYYGDIVLWWDSSNGIVITTGTGGSGTDVSQGSTTGWASNTWHHVAVVRVGTALNIYRDGTSVVSATNSIDIDNTGEFFIGSSDGSGYFTGYLDMFRMSKFARYTSGGFTLPTTAFTDDINTTLLLNADINQGTWAEDTSTGLAISTDSRMKFPGSDDYLYLADSSDWSFGTDNFTWEFWVNFAAHYNSGGDGEYLLKFGDYPNEQSYIYYYPDTAKVEWAWRDYQSPYGFGSIASSTTDWPLGQWIHIAAVRNGTTFTLYRNGVSVGSDTDSAAMSPEVGNSGFGLIIGGSNDTQHHLNGYMDEIRISDTARYTGTFTPQTRGNPFEADANTLLLIHSDYTGGLGADSSGNYNNFTATNLVATDQMVDTPTNNFSTMNPLSPQAHPMSEGNLWVSTSVAESSSNTIGMESGKWYFEVLPDSSSFTLGIVNDPNIRLDTTSSHVVCAFNNGGTVSTPNSTESSDTFSSGSSGDIYGFAIDADAKTLDVYQNNTKVIEVTSFTIDAPYFFSVDRNSSVTVNQKMNFGADSSFAGTVTAQGNQDGNEKGDFYYTPPSGFLALCTDNISAPEIKLPGENFNTILWTGDDSNPDSFTGTGFEADFIWVKNRDASQSHRLYDQVRGGGYALFSNSTSAQTFEDGGGYITSFDSDGFTAGGTTNTNFTDPGDDFVAWNWKAGGAPTADNSAGAGATPTAGSVKIDGSNLGSALAGSIAATRLSANTTSGFSIVEYVGTESAATVAHGLSQVPELIFYKNVTNTSNGEWAVYSNELTSNNYYLVLNTNAIQDQDTGRFNDTTPTSSVFTVGGSWITNGSGNSIIAYCFHGIEGYSKVGSFVGNYNADGTFIYLGFRPAWFMWKRAIGSGGDDGGWVVKDNKRPSYGNVIDEQLYANDSGAENDGNNIDFVSNGVKMRNTAMQGTSTTYLYLAFAESPFKYSNAR